MFADAAGTQQRLQLSSVVTYQLYGKIADGQPLPAATGTINWHLDDNSMKDLWLVLTWGEA
ncbi:MAG: hypothetical protein ICV72_13500 [Aldersonia sp.]|nr:hypothetical protein [Aldersonia sp.]